MDRIDRAEAGETADVRRRRSREQMSESLLTASFIILSGGLQDAYASTMCIGNMRSGTEALCVYFHTREREVLHKALTYFGVIGLFAVGAGLGALLAALLAERGIWVSCALLAVSFLIMFIREEEKKK